MPDTNPGTLDIITTELVNVLMPIKQRVEDDDILLLLAELGIQFPETLNADSAFNTAMDTLVSNIADMPEFVKVLIDAIEAEDWGAVAEKSIELIEKIIESIDNFVIVKDALEGFSLSEFSGLSGTEQSTLDEFIGNFVRNLFDWLLIKYLERKSEIMVSTLEFFGVLDRSVENEGSVSAVAPEYIKYKLHLSNVGALFSDPGKLLGDLYQWGRDDFTGKAMFAKLHKICSGLGFPSVYDSNSPKLDVLFMSIEPNLAMSPPGLDITLAEIFGLDGSFSVGDDKWSLILSMSAAVEVGAVLTLSPKGDVSIEQPTTAFSGDITLRFEVPGSGAAEPFILIGDPGASRFEFENFYLEAGAGMEVDGLVSSGKFHVEGGLENGKIIIKPRDPDGFFSKNITGRRIDHRPKFPHGL